MPNAYHTFTSGPVSRLLTACQPIISSLPYCLLFAHGVMLEVSISQCRHLLTGRSLLRQAEEAAATNPAEPDNSKVSKKGFVDLPVA